VTASTAATGRVAPRPGKAPRARLGPLPSVGLGVAVLYLSLLVLLPLAAVASKGIGAGWHDFWGALTDHQAASALELTVASAAGVTVITAVFGTLVAWVLVRDEFWGKRLIEVVIDIPFALPTIVAGIVLLSLYGADSPVGLHLYGTRPGIIVALLFVTLPFVVRTVQPVLLELDAEVEEAAASLGASPITTFRRIVLPTIRPAVLSGAALAFARAMGEYGSVVLIAGGLPRTQMAPMYVYQQIQNDDLAGAAATSTVLLLISVLVLSLLAVIQHRSARRA
jgi:sulfate/thiosulfate transport system permease protein